MAARGTELWAAYLLPDQDLGGTLLAAIADEEAARQAREGRPLAALLKLRRAIEGGWACDPLEAVLTERYNLLGDFLADLREDPSAARPRIRALGYLDSIARETARADSEAARADSATARAASEAAHAASATARAAYEAARADSLVADQVWTRGLPVLERTGGSGALSTSTHQSVGARVGEFNGIAGGFAWGRGRPSSIYGVLDGGRLTYSNEHAVAGYVKLVLTDIVRCHPELRGVVSIDAEVTVASLRPDIMVLSIDKLPVGYCEVKMPGRWQDPAAPLSQGNVLGQAYDYAMDLRLLHGRQWAFVILTTFTDWRVLWLDDDAGNYGAQLTVVDDESAAVPRATVEFPGPVCSGVVHGEGRPDVATFIASVLLKMAKSPRTASEHVYRPQLTRDGMLWRRYVEPRDTGYSFPDDPSPPFVRLGQLARGRDGSCWVVAKGAEKFVLKIVQKGAGDDNQAAMRFAQLEASRWEAIWGVPSRAVEVLGRHALVVPYVAIFPDAASYLDRVHAVERAVLEMARRGFVHRDLFRDDRSVKYWHFGELRGRVVAIDLRDMTEMDAAAALAEAQQRIDEGQFRSVRDMND